MFRGLCVSSWRSLFRCFLLGGFSISWFFYGAGRLFAAEFSGFRDVSELPVRVEMPSPLVTGDGRQIQSVTEWSARREEMKRVLEHYAIGHQAPAPSEVVARDVTAEVLMKNGVACKWVRLSFGVEHALGFEVAVMVPQETAAFKAPFPTVVMPVFSMPPQDGSWDEMVKTMGEPLRRGYAVVAFNYQQCGLDAPGQRQSGFFPAYPNADWGCLAAWAWGMSRCVDYLKNQPFADSSKLIALGHSRLGKAALIAGAFDERFALTISAGSGCGGTGAYRFNGQGRGGKEGLEDVAKKFPHWFGPRFGEFSGKVDHLPWDQHWLIALVAPRCFIATDGLDDPYTSENALNQSCHAARPVYQLLGVPDHLSVHFRPGKHLLAPEDWRAALDFADQQLRR